jgi:hypothetical protein
LTLADSTTPSVPSEPTISLARLNGPIRLDELVEVVAADTPQHARIPSLDFVAMIQGQVADHLIALTFE